MTYLFLTDFFPIRPQYESTQEASLRWMVAAHVQAETLLRGVSHESEEIGRFQEEFQAKLWRVGCKPEHIHKRGHFLKDFLHDDWNQMEIYRLKESPSGVDLSVRQKIFAQWTDLQFDLCYPEGHAPPEELIHVSCTGYTAPSSAQRLVAKRSWGAKTSVLHAYHMGCYGSMPAIRIAAGGLALGKNQVDIVHTEGCSLHINPSLHEADQLVSQSLFADGCIRYSMQRQKMPNSPHLALQASHDEIIEGSTTAMTWTLSSWGFQMSLVKEIPVLIMRALPPFLEQLAKKAGWTVTDLVEHALFAVHTGGPKILSYVGKTLGLKTSQLQHTQQTLWECGNMSSATLPHIWYAMVRDAAIPSGTPIVSLAFGPGLSIWSTLMEKGD